VRKVQPYRHAHFIQAWRLNIDFVNPSLGLGARVAVELDLASARALVLAIQAALAQAEAAGHADSGMSS
jgi:hypothetical protein